MIEKVVDKRSRVALAGLAAMTLETIVFPGCSEPSSETGRVFPLNEQDLYLPTEEKLGRQALELFTKPRTGGVPFAKRGKEQVTEGARFSWAEAGGRKFQLNRGYLVLNDGSMYDLGTPGGLVMANALVEAYLMRRFPKAAPWWGRLPDTALEDIGWMSRKLTILSLSTNFISPHDLVALARGMHTLESAGNKDIPGSLAINPTKLPPPGTLKFNGEPYRALAVWVLEKNPHLLAEYQKGVDEVLARISRFPLRPDFLGVSDFAYQTYQDSPKQEFLTTFGYFLQNAEYIKNRIEVAKKAGFFDEAAVLEVKLKILQQWLEGPAKDTSSLGMSFPQIPNEAFHPGCPTCRSLFP